MGTWPAEAIWEAVAPLLPGFTVEVLPEIDSTNTELMRRARAGQTDPVLLVAERQSAGIREQPAEIDGAIVHRDAMLADDALEQSVADIGPGRDQREIIIDLAAHAVLPA